MTNRFHLRLEIGHLRDEDGRDGQVEGRAVFVDGGAHGQNEAGDPRVDVVLSLCDETKH